jgi:hypothetical protein
MLQVKTTCVSYYKLSITIKILLFITGAMPIPLDIANLASSHMIEDDVDIGPLDLANLNSSSIHGDLPPQMEEPILPGSAQVNKMQMIN